MNSSPKSSDLDQIIEKHNQGAGLQRHLSNRHIQLIAIGGAIGTGLFMGSGRTIHLAGPSVLLVYLIIGAVLFLVMRAMGEVLLSDHGYGTFSDFVADILCPEYGFIVGWTYWLCWIVTGTADVVAITGYLHFWWPNLHPALPALGCVLLLFILNAMTVKAFGETEFWFAMIKIIAIVCLIICGLVMVIFAFKSPDGTTAQVANLWSHPGENGSGIFPHGLRGFLGGFQLAIFSFVGIELVGTTAAETKDPEKSLPKAVNSIPIRVLLFYVLALTAIMMVTPWDKLDPESSPFVGLFSLVGLPIAASVVNLVVLTSAASSCNSGIYSTSRMIYGLALRGDAPKPFSKLSKRKVPLRALGISCLFLLFSLPLVTLGGTIMEVFTLVTSVSSILFMFIWTSTTIAYVVYRYRRPQLHQTSHFKLPGGYLSAVVVFVFIAAMLVVLAQDATTAKAMVVSVFWFVLMGIAVYFTRRHPHNQQIVAAHKQKVAQERQAAKAFRAASR